MALLSLCVESGLDVMVAFVNYHLRETSDLEEQLVREYCETHSIEMKVCYPVQTGKGNFQNWAREARYDFYRQVCEENGCDALLLGHQKDDVVENYLMALKRNSRGWHYGIDRETCHHGMTVIRPLLEYRKQELRKYCEDHAVPYHDDESNFTDRYQRNRIRHALVEKAGDDQIETWVSEIREFNRCQDALLEGFVSRYGSEEISLESFRNESEQDALLRWLLYRHDPEITVSSDWVSDTVRSLNESVKGHKNLSNGSQLVWEYGVMYVFTPAKPYEYVLHETECLQTPYFTLCDHGMAIEGMTLSDDDFPLTVRPYKTGDAIELRFGHKKVSRFMIDRKILRKDRLVWPVVENRHNKVIFVMGIGCDISHYSANPSLYMIK